jgi:branched-chain amino acid transport system permease protein
MLTAYMIYSLLFLGIGPAIVLSLILVVLVGLFIYRILIGPLREKEARVATITLGTAIVFQELVKIIWGPGIKSIPTIIEGYTIILGITVVNQKLLALFVSVGIVTCLWIFINRTRLGKAVRAVAQNLEVAQLVGINVQKIFMTSVAISALLAGFAAIIFVPVYYVSPDGWTILFRTFPVLVLGGLGSLKGSVVAAFIIAFVEKIVEFNLGGGYIAQTVTFAVMLAIIFTKPSGLFGKSVK